MKHDLCKPLVLALDVVIACALLVFIAPSALGPSNSEGFWDEEAVFWARFHAVLLGLVVVLAVWTWRSDARFTGQALPIVLALLAAKLTFDSYVTSTTVGSLMDVWIDLAFTAVAIILAICNWKCLRKGS